MYGAAGAVWVVFWSRKTMFCPEVVLSIVALVAGVRPVCIQWRRVFVIEVLVGMSRSIMMTAYEVPVNRLVVPTRGWVAVTRHR